jgi:hypothetical protein
MHPDVTVSAGVTPFRHADVFTPGDKLEYGTLTVDVILDENMNVYKEMLDWCNKLVETKYISPTNQPDMRFDKDMSIYDITLSILSSHNNMIDKITYKGAFPINIGTVNFQSTVDSVQYITFPVTFYYTTFSITD